MDQLPLERGPERLRHAVVPAHSGSADRLPHAEVHHELAVVTREVLPRSQWKMIPVLAPPRAPAAIVRASATSLVRMWSAIE